MKFHALPREFPIQTVDIIDANLQLRVARLEGFPARVVKEDPRSARVEHNEVLPFN